MRRLFAVTILLGILVATSGCWPRNSGYSMQNGKVGGYSYLGMWHTQPEPDEVVHVVIIPFGATYSSFGTSGLNHAPPSQKGIDTFPDGLFVDGVCVPTGSGLRVFVYTKARKMRPVPLDDEELTALDPDVFKELPETDVWKTKILPVLEEEKW